MSPPRPDTSELLTNSQMYEADRLAVASGISGELLMENAGRACADEICRRYGAQNVVVICGTGNNGGDGFVIARLLRDRGWPVRVLLAGDSESLGGDAQIMYERWEGSTDALSLEGVAGARFVVDAIFGAGLSRPLEGLVRQVVRHLKDQPATVIAVDMPSGVVGSTGQCHGDAIAADLTITFFRKKIGHTVLPGARLCGDVVVADIGIPETVLEHIAPATWENRPQLWRGELSDLGVEDHKYTRGHAVVVSGHMSSTGAARLGARAALRAGAGLVTLASPKDALLVNAAHLTTVMLAACEDAPSLEQMLSDKRKNAVLVGPGLGIGEGTQDIVAAALTSGASVVLDADALTSFEGLPGKLGRLVAAKADRGVVVTPHSGEFFRLFKFDSHDNLGKLEAVRQAANSLGAVCLLKGADTVIAAPDGRAAINCNAPPHLATAGSGDVLAGIITGLMAQNMPAFEAACAGVWLHGEAGNNLGRGTVARDIPEQLPEVFATLDSPIA